MNCLSLQNRVLAFVPGKKSTPRQSPREVAKVIQGGRECSWTGEVEIAEKSQVKEVTPSIHSQSAKGKRATRERHSVRNVPWIPEKPRSPRAWEGVGSSSGGVYSASRAPRPSGSAPGTGPGRRSCRQRPDRPGSPQPARWPPGARPTWRPRLPLCGPHRPSPGQAGDRPRPRAAARRDSCGRCRAAERRRGGEGVGERVPGAGRARPRGGQGAPPAAVARVC